MNYCEPLDKIQKLLQFWREWFTHDVLDKYVIDFLFQTIEQDASLFEYLLILLIARITDIEDFTFFLNKFFILNPMLIITRKLLVSILQKILLSSKQKSPFNKGLFCLIVNFYIVEVPNQSPANNNIPVRLCIIIVPQFAGSSNLSL